MIKAIMKAQMCNEEEAKTILNDSLSTMAYDIRNGDNRYRAARTACLELCIPLEFQQEIFDAYDKWLEENPDEEPEEENCDFDIEDIINMDSVAGININELKEMFQ